MAVALGPLAAGLAGAATPAGFEEVTPVEGKNWDNLPPRNRRPTIGPGGAERREITRLAPISPHL